MDAAWLSTQLAEGRSIESIAREVGRDPSTVAYWVNKHGLASRYADRHRAKGALSREELQALVEEGLSVQQIAQRLGRGGTTVRHWLRRHELRTVRAGRLAVADAAAAPATGSVDVRKCRRHGFTAFVFTKGGRWRCKRCRTAAVTARRRRVKRMLIAEAGGSCRLCGYDRWPGALQFHHLDPSQKSFSLAAMGLARSLEKARAEVAKCVLVCANCHAEIEGGLATIRPSEPCR
jgi:excisionase family DNA binding protein